MFLFDLQVSLLMISDGSKEKKITLVSKEYGKVTEKLRSESEREKKRFTESFLKLNKSLSLIANGDDDVD